MAQSFADFELLTTLQQTLKEKSLNKPTEIQLKAIPALMAGRSLIAVAETGSGKTLAYALPMLHLLKNLELGGDKVAHDRQPRAVVIVPTRELGEQVSRVFKVFTHTTRLRVRTVLGGTAMQVAKENVAGSFEILVATPGRLLKMINRRQVDLSAVRFLIFDEVDQMLDAGFVEDSRQIVMMCPAQRQVALISATVSPIVQDLIQQLFQGLEVIRTAGSDRLVAQLKTENRTVLEGKRLPVLEKLMGEKTEGGTLIFTNTREQCDDLAEELLKKKVSFVIYRGEMDKIERRSNLKAFRDGKVKYMISTDLASRGLDVEHVGRVINYNMPKQMESYLHRVGRTARAGRAGLVINFITERDLKMVEKIKTLI